MEEKKYKVVGATAVMGHEPGSTFTATIPPPHEKRLLDRGSVKVVKKTTPKRKGKKNG